MSAVFIALRIFFILHIQDIESKAVWGVTTRNIYRLHDRCRAWAAAHGAHVDATPNTHFDYLINKGPHIFGSVFISNKGSCRHKALSNQLLVGTYLKKMVFFGFV